MSTVRMPPPSRESLSLVKSFGVGITIGIACLFFYHDEMIELIIGTISPMALSFTFFRARN